MDSYEREYDNDDEANERMQEIIDRLYDIIENSGKGFFGPTFDKSTVLMLLEDLRAEIPREVGQAKFIMDKRDRILEEAEADADKMRADAEVEAQRIVSQHETTRRANEWAEQKMNEANDYYREMCTGANRYAEACLDKAAALIEQRLDSFRRTAKDTEEELMHSIREIVNNKASLMGDDREETEYYEE